MAFIEDNEPIGWTIINYIIDLSFLIDMVLTFFTAYIDSETKRLVTDKKTIATDYFKSWFIIDLISIMPISQIVDYVQNNSGVTDTSHAVTVAKLARLARVAKIVRLMKIVRLTKLLRVCKFRKKIT